jgi:hypothetical protein
MVDDETYHKNREVLFECDGWKDIVDEFKALEELTNRLDSINNEEDLWFMKGQLSIMRQIITLEDVASQITTDNTKH